MRAAGDGARWFRQEYFCEFSDVSSGLFDGDLVERAMSDEFDELDLGDMMSRQEFDAEPRQ